MEENPAANRLMFADRVSALDKLDKKGPKGVKSTLLEWGWPKKAVTELDEFLQFKAGTININNLSDLEKFVTVSQKGKEGLEEIQKLLNYTQEFENVKLDPTLARGLDYYTGTIFEVKVEDVDIGSIAAGGRYDDLCSTFGLSDVSGIGISFGVDRIYDVMEELALFPDRRGTTTQVLITQFNEEVVPQCLQYLQQLRDEDIHAEIYPEPKKLGKQFKYADKKGIPYVIVAGPEELENDKLGLKNMESGDQTDLPFEEIVKQLQHG
jgi:histidyl-tRNA synthetase